MVDFFTLLKYLSNAVRNFFAPNTSPKMPEPRQLRIQFQKAPPLEYGAKRMPAKYSLSATWPQCLPKPR